MSGRMEPTVWKQKKTACTLGILAALPVLLLLLLLHWKEQEIQQRLAEQVLRFQVRANSDSRADQADKLAVRDAVLASVKELFAEEQKEEKGTDETAAAADKAAGKRILEHHLEEIGRTAEEALRQRGTWLPVTAVVRKVWFPQKTYGELTLPCGSYEALQITIGEGRGHNWWCMLYPSLCFTDALRAVPVPEEEEKLQTILDDEGYDALFRRGKIRFSFFFKKFLE